MKYIKIFESFDEMKNVIEDCLRDLDLSKDEVPFMYEIKSEFSNIEHRYTKVDIPKGSVCIRFFTDRPDLYFEKARYFTVGDYNKFIFPLVSRILDEGYIEVYGYLISANLTGRIELFSSKEYRYNSTLFIDKNGEFGAYNNPLSDGPNYSDPSTLLHEVNIIFREL